jgi:hypothetical protein
VGCYVYGSRVRRRDGRRCWCGCSLVKWVKGHDCPGGEVAVLVRRCSALLVGVYVQVSVSRNGPSQEPPSLTDRGLPPKIVGPGELTGDRTTSTSTYDALLNISLNHITRSNNVGSARHDEHERTILPAILVWTATSSCSRPSILTFG